MRRGETGAMNSAKLSVHLVPQQTDQYLPSSWQARNFEIVTGGKTKPPSAGTRR